MRFLSLRGRSNFPFLVEPSFVVWIVPRQSFLRQFVGASFVLQIEASAIVDSDHDTDDGEEISTC
jgi:hypothetical protein